MQNSTEIAPGIFIPTDRALELEAFKAADPAIAAAIEDMTTVLTEVAPSIFVQRCDVATWIAKMEIDPVFAAAMDALMDRLNTDALIDTTITLNLTPSARKLCQRHSVADFALNFASHNPLQ